MPATLTLLTSPKSPACIKAVTKEVTRWEKFLHTTSLLLWKGGSTCVLSTPRVFLMASSTQSPIGPVVVYLVASRIPRVNRAKMTVMPGNIPVVMAAYKDVGRFTCSHSILSFGTEPRFIPYHNIVLMGTPSQSTSIPSYLATLAPDC